MTPLLTCTCCGRQISRAEWPTLRLVGIHECEGEAYELELRNCACRSTLSLQVPLGCGARPSRDLAARLTARLYLAQTWLRAVGPYLAPCRDPRRMPSSEWAELEARKRAVLSAYARDVTPLAEGPLYLEVR